MPSQVTAKRDNKSVAPKLSIKWFGASAFEFRFRDTILLVDPFLSRPNILKILLSELKPNKKLLEKHFRKADYILVSHGHYDHIMDVPYVALLSKAKVCCSASASFILLACKLPHNQFQIISAGDVLQLGDILVRVVKSRHNSFFLGEVPFKGVLTAPPKPPLKASDYKVGEVFGFDLAFDDYHVYLTASSNLIDESLLNIKADTLILSLAGYQYTNNYLERIINTIKPTTIIPSHHDNFTFPLSWGKISPPTYSHKKTLSEIRQFDPSVDIVDLDFFQEYIIELPRNKKAR